MTTPMVRMYRCEGCGGQHPYACQRAAELEIQVLRTECDALRALLLTYEPVAAALQDWRALAAEAMEGGSGLFNVAARRVAVKRTRAALRGLEVALAKRAKQEA